MVDERGRDKNQICNGGRRAKNGMRDNYRFILPTRALHFRSVSKTASTPEDLGHQRNWRTSHSKRCILDALRKFWRKILGCVRLPIHTDSSQRYFSRFWSIFLEHSKDGPHTILNGGLRRIPITLTGNCCRIFLNLCLQHLIEAQLVLRSYCEVVHLGTDVLQELVGDLNVFANFIIYPYLIFGDIFERRFTSTEVLPHTILLAVVEPEIGFVPPSIEALIRIKTIVGITNKVDVLGDRRAVDAHVAHFSTLFPCYSSVDHFEMIEDRVLKLFHKKINLSGEHVHLFKLVNLVGVGLSALLVLALVRGHLLNQFMSFLNTESEERTSSSSIYMLLG
jgi:hypothetical protein